MPIKKKEVGQIIDSRHMKILSVKKKQLADSVVLVCLDQDKFGQIDKAALQSLIKKIDDIEPSGIYFPLFKKMNVEFYDKFEFKNRDILVTLNYDLDEEIDLKEIENEIKQAIPEAKSISFIHRSASIERK